MNKSISISLGGLAFFIEEDAYAQLQQYIEAVKKSLRHDDDKEEIIKDVETRIAELFKQYLGGNREVINNLDVSEVINVLGTPEQINDGEADIPATESTHETARKKLYRDTDDKFVSGVCSGLAHYFGMEVLWLRIILLILLFSGFGSALVVIPYLVMVILVPEARTVSEKLEMRGKPVTFDNIKSWSEIEKASSKIGKSLEAVFQALGTIFSKLFGIAFIVISVGLIGATITFSFYKEFIGEMPIEFYDTDWKRTLAIVLTYFIILVPALSFFFSGIRLLYKRNALKFSPYLTTTILVSWIIAIIVLINLSVFNYSIFSRESVERKTSIELPSITSDTLTVASVDYQNLIKFGGKPFLFWNGKRERNIEGDTMVVKIKNEMEIIESKDSAYRMDVVFATHITKRENADEALKAIQYQFKVDNGKLVMNTFLKVHKSYEYRDQDVRITLHVPNGKFVKNDNIEHFYFNHGQGWEDFWHNPNTLFLMTNNKFINTKTNNNGVINVKVN